MKKGLIAVFALAAVVLVLIVGVGVYLFMQQAEKTVAARDFNNNLVDERNVVAEKFIEFGNKYESYNKEERETALQGLKDVSAQGLENVKLLEAPEGGEDLKAAGVDLLEFYVTFAESNFEDQELLAREPELNKAFLDAQKDFAYQYGLEIASNNE